MIKNYEETCIRKIEKINNLFNSNNRLLKNYAKIKDIRLKKINSCNISPKCKFGKNIYIAHPNNIIIGETSIINNNILIYPGVSLLSNPHKIEQNSKNRRHPIISDNCILYANCMIIGDVTIGKNCIIGGGAIVTKSIPDNSIVINVNEIKKNNDDNLIFINRIIEKHKKHLMFKNKKKGSDNNE